MMDRPRERDIFRIGDNPYRGRKVFVRWKRAWGGKPRGFEIEGELVDTFVVRGRTLIGEVRVPSASGGSRIVSAPWSRNWIEVEVLHA